MKKLLIVLTLLVVGLTACSITDTYVIDFDSKGGTAVDTIEVESGEFIVLPTDPTKEGFTFGGWYYDEELSNEVDTTLPVDQDWTLYAKWIAEPGSIVVTFQDGSAIVETVIVDGETLEETPSTFKSGYDFKGWYYSDDFTHKYVFSDTITESITLYGKWDKIVNVTLYTSETEMETIEYSGTVGDIPIPTIEGFVFEGWYTDDTFTTKFDSSDIFTEDTTMYANFVPVNHLVYLVYDIYALGRFALDFGEEFVLEEVTLNGLTFVGWYQDDDLTIPVTTITGTTETQYIYAKYEQEVVNLPEETDVDLPSLGYYSYLSETNPVVHIHIKDIGTISLELFPTVAPNTVNNFIEYIEDGSYTNSSFHRIIEDFMIQGGIVENTACPIVGEFSTNGVTNDLSHTRGVLSMARTTIMNSATSQFFIVHSDSTYLDNSYASFGGVVNGFNVLDYIATLTTNSSDGPIREVIIESIMIEYNGYVPTDRVCAN